MEQESTRKEASCGEGQTYDVKSCAPNELSAAEIAACVTIIESGGAVNPGSAATELSRASLVAVARRGVEVVGVGAIKRVRTNYATRRANLSGATFDRNTPELGYVAVAGDYGNQGLSKRIVAALISQHTSRLFATTDNPYMKKTLANAGFVQQGHEWDGHRGRLSLWIRD